MADSIKVQGWCPTAWKPMRAQDGWIVRIRPHCASVSAQQWRTIAELALSHAHPQIELTRLGNVQLRGVSEAKLDWVRSQLIAAQLVPADPDADLCPPVHCSPFYQPQGPTHTLAQLLSKAVAAYLSPRALHQQGIDALPSKFGVLVDDEARSLRGISADLRLWAETQGGYGLALGDSSHAYGYESASEVVNAALQVAMWFAQRRSTLEGTPPTRLQPLLTTSQSELEKLLSANPQACPPSSKAATAPIKPGVQGQYQILGAPLGRIAAREMLELANALPAHAEVRITPWRSLLINTSDAAISMPSLNNEHWITDAADTRLRVSACTGAPRCTQAHIPAQEMALQSAPHTLANTHLHISGCPKLCALPKEATAVVFASQTDSGQVQLNASPAGQPLNPLIQISYQASAPVPAEIQKRLHDLSI